MESEIRLFTRNAVAKAKAVVANPDEPADPERGDRFTNWAILTLHAIRIELKNTTASLLICSQRCLQSLTKLGLHDSHTTARVVTGS